MGPLGAQEDDIREVVFVWSFACYWGVEGNSGGSFGSAG